MFLNKKAAWLFSFAVGTAAMLLLHAPDAPRVNLFWFGTMTAIGVFAFDLLPTFATAVILLLFYVVTGVSDPGTVFNGWLSPIIWLCMCGMLIGRLMEKSRLAERIALLTISRIATSPVRLYLACLAAGFAVGSIVPDMITVILIFMAIASGMCGSLNLDRNSKAASTLVMAVYLGANISGAAFLPNNIGLPGLIMVKDMGVPFSWLEFLAENLPFQLIHALIAFTILHLFGGKELGRLIADCREKAASDLRALGPVGASEKKILLLALLALIAFMTESLHGIPGFYAFCSVVMLGFTPIFGLLESSDLGKVQFHLLFFTAGCMAIGTVAASLGVPAWLAQKLLPVLDGIACGPIISLLAYWTGVLVNMLLTPMAAATSLSAPIAQIAADLGLSIKPVLYSFLYGLDQFILPYELTPALIMFSTGYVRMRYLMTIMALRLVCVSLAVLVVSAFVWPLMGL